MKVNISCHHVIHTVTNCHSFFEMRKIEKNFIRTKSFTDVKPTKDDEGADFEEAIAKTGYGKFNYVVLLIALPCCMSNVYDTTTMSIILPSAECDLNLTLQDKGMLNAITYMGEEYTRRFDDDPYWFVGCNFLHFFHYNLY